MTNSLDRQTLIHRARMLSNELSELVVILESDEGWAAETRPAWVERLNGAWAGWMARSTPAMCWLYGLQQAAIPAVAWALQRGEALDFDPDIVEQARALLKEVDERGMKLGAEPIEQHAIGVVRHLVAQTYPEHAGAFDDRQVAELLKIWARHGGPRPSNKSGGKWEDLAEALERAGITSGVGGHALEAQWKKWNRAER